MDGDPTLQWRTASVPVGVSVEPGPDVDPAGNADDDPSGSRVVTEDAAWEAALDLLADDEEYLRRRATLGDLGLHLVVRDVEEMELSAWPSPAAVEDVVLVVPAAMVLAEDSRVDAYLQAVATMVLSAQEQLGLEG